MREQYDICILSLEDTSASILLDFSNARTLHDCLIISNLWIGENYRKEMTVWTFVPSVSFVWCLVGTIVYTAYLAFTRLYLSPLSHFPGPKLAAWTFWYAYLFSLKEDPDNRRETPAYRDVLIRKLGTNSTMTSSERVNIYSKFENCTKNTVPL